MNKKSPVPAYRLLSKPSNKLKLFINHYESPCRIESISVEKLTVTAEKQGDQVLEQFEGEELSSNLKDERRACIGSQEKVKGWNCAAWLYVGLDL